MKIDVSLITGVIYTCNNKTKEDVTYDAIRAVTIRLIEGYKTDFVVVSKKDNKKYVLSLKEVKK